MGEKNVGDEIQGASEKNGMKMHYTVCEESSKVGGRAQWYQGRLRDGSPGVFDDVRDRARSMERIGGAGER